MVVTLPKSTPSVKLFVKVLLLSTKNSSMNKPNVKLKNYYLLTIDPCLFPIPEDANPRNTEEEVPDLESKNLTDENIL